MNITETFIKMKSGEAAADLFEKLWDELNAVSFNEKLTYYFVYEQAIKVKGVKLL